MRTGPRKLTVSPNRTAPGTYVVMIGRTPVGFVQRNDRDSRTADISYSFSPERGNYPRPTDAPDPFAKLTMKAIREGLTQKISRDTYLQILEKTPEKPEG
jgi:hypothetical protein